MADAEAALGTKLHRYGRDEHYDVISAFIKSVRGSDPRPRSTGWPGCWRRGRTPASWPAAWSILASEDVGEADPTALVVATAAAQAVEFVGLPEAQLNLAQAVVHLATAPKSNRAALGLWRAQEDVRKGVGGEVPAHLRDAPLPVGRARSGTAWATTILTTTPGAGSASSTSPTGRGARRTTSPPATATSRRSPSAWNGWPPTTTDTRTGHERHRPRRRDRRRLQRGRGRAAGRGHRRLIRTLKALREVASLLRTETVPVLEDLRDTVDAANHEIVRLDRLVTTAESVTGTVDSASRLAYIAMANPVIKGVAFASGTAKAARRLRGRKAEGTGPS